MKRFVYPQHEHKLLALVKNYDRASCRSIMYQKKQVAEQKNSTYKGSFTLGRNKFAFANDS